ncbi:hypothetical protein [Aurantiacibacter rhizosphaerae]|uniref:Uncharacterized protein n=1 Tax=Aurantiacibacter rhizosphaerae TaxID=2691582 RepID=A0A844XBN0_9SPHN|nr:hypothetical protein [Aurantiacibacter rhizosphaerae]MWV27891.1 hypothetical protein [Aurantiacibacter rhizosphaerae]
MAAYSVARGGQPEKWCAAIIGGEVLVDLLILLVAGPRSFGQFQFSRILLDAVACALLIAVAMRANRMYPLALAAAQIVALIGSIAALLASEGMAQAFWAMTQAPLFIQLALLALGTLAHGMRVARIGPYNCWSPPVARHSQPG